MANRAHVPQFGNWGNGGENVLYTAYFDNARKGKNGKIMNPNDPNENPSAFPAQPQQPQVKSNSSRTRPEQVVQARPQTDNRSTRTNDNGGRQNDYQPRPNPAARGPPAADSYNKQNSNDRGANSRDNSRRPTVPQNNARTEQSPHHPYQANNGGYQANNGGRAGVSPSPSWENKPSGNNAGSTPNRRPQQRPATVLPKFGDWDEKNPNAGAGYTQIFNVVREEKKQIAANVNTPQQEEAPIRGKPRHDAKMACCFL
ncbi:RPM1-interacting protein 4-like [Papaver somniferum]|uniref:RPM1-interacting protein 4-like n=1 Tax=Papaver somniferum TaxID=3469 RepID=UPI000E7040EC|nr:RPM1-interacting protein 4-like [Papaver somniferum]